MTPEEFDALAAQGRNRIPLMCEVLADLDTPLSVYLKLADGPHSYFVRQIDAVNREDENGNRMVRIHAVGFPFYFEPGRQASPTTLRYAQLMRILTERNGGTFVALSDPNRD